MEASSTHSKPRHHLEMNHELNVLTALQKGKSCWCQSGSWLGGSGACLKNLKKKRISWLSMVINLQLLLDCPPRILNIIPTNLVRFHNLATKLFYNCTSKFFRIQIV
jgi:hypothetical protein